MIAFCVLLDLKAFTRNQTEQMITDTGHLFDLYVELTR
jgi:hypothetical protein